MPSFSWSTRFREGQWRAFRKFALEERQDAEARVAVINAEMDRIGNVLIGWERDENGVPTERRTAFRVDPGTSLGKLTQAYVALGGNPFDISAFAGPDSGAQLGDREILTTPHGGLVSRMGLSYALDSGAGSRDVTFLKYRESRFGGPRVSPSEGDVLDRMSRARKWISQEIRHKRNRLEERIIKLCDLREQLEEELEDIAWAMDGAVPGVDYNPDRFNSSLSMGYIAYYFDGIFRVQDEDRSVPVNDDAEEGQPGAVNIAALGDYPTLLSDLPEEEGSAC